MPPQTTIQPQQIPPPAPNSQFEFMMKDQPKPPGRFGSMWAGLPKPVRIALPIIGVIIILVIGYSVLFGRKVPYTQQMVGVAARAQEISRVSQLVTSNSKDTDAKSLAATVNASMASQETAIQNYLTKNKAKVDPKLYLGKLDKKTDQELDVAKQNNAYEQAYYSYLKSSLADYQKSLAAVYPSLGNNGKDLLASANDSVKVILNAPQLR